MTDPLTPKDLQDYLDVHEIEGEFVIPELPTPTVEAAAAAVQVSPDQIVKTLLFLIEGQSDEENVLRMEDGSCPVLVIASGLGRIDRRLLGQHYGVSRRKTHFADPETVLALTGYPVGAVPPIGHRQRIPVLVDPAVLDYPVVYGGGGSKTALLRMNPADILVHNDAEVIPIQKVEAQE
jgi:prolyl-tRNA editing enzyme YbaK/EbsC (Cys-tRNA(Pro) deacylase)